MRASGSSPASAAATGSSFCPPGTPTPASAGSESACRDSARRSSLRTAPTSASACSSTDVALGLPGLAQCLHDAPEGRHALPVDGREVGAGVEGAAVGSAEDRHGPAARAGQGLGGRHVDGVEIGTLLAVHLDRDEPAGQVRGRRLVLEALVSHDVAPMARRVADGEEDALVLFPGQAKGLVAPRVPRHRVVGVLAEIRARLVGQVVHGRDARARPTIATAPFPWRAAAAPVRHPCKARAMELELRGKTALVTGASRGIGLAIATRFAEAGANVMVVVPQGRGPGRGGGGPGRQAVPPKSGSPGTPRT